MLCIATLVVSGARADDGLYQPLVGDAAKDLRQWIRDALTGQQTLSPIVAPEAEAGDEPLAQGYERTRVRTTEMNGQPLVWTERVAGAVGIII